MIDLTKISPSKAYTTAETADLLGMSQGSLRNKLSKKSTDPFIKTAQPVNIGKEWVFNGSRILEALGTPSINLQAQILNIKNKMKISRKALKFAKVKHRGQKYGKEAYITHPIATVGILASVAPQDESLLAAGYLHDILEDTDTTYEDLEKIFGKDIAGLVREVTKSKYNTFPYLSTRRGVMLKFADRLANLIMMESKDKKWQKRYIKKSRFWK